MSRNGRGDEREMWAQAAMFGALGTEFVAVIFGAFFIGQWIDERFETMPWGMVTLVAFGLVGTGLHIYRIARRFVDTESRDD